MSLGLLLFASLPLTAAPQEIGPPIGAKVPDIGTPPDQTGAQRSLASLMGEKGLVLFFFRSADWCPFCQAQMMDLNTAVAAIERRGYKMAGISFDSPQILNTFIERRSIKYTLLSDPKSEIIDRYRASRPAIRGGQLRLRRSASRRLRSRQKRDHQGEALRGGLHEASACNTGRRSA